ncbi:MAG: oligopeptide/dipeptide ABC transporter ATP-binding protein [Thermodesulfobacteriota bacterium]|nr:oligopeptide/dipeptide ABC transporter ATP-binding protein [Thermodesulfobacteriota bacterium]
MNNGKETIIELERIVKKYASRASFFGARGKDIIALNMISIKILRGEIFGLVGESGSGKTTAGRLIARLEKPEQGRIYLKGLEMGVLKGKALKNFPRKVQMIFQDPYQSLNPQLSIFDTISEPLVIHKIGNAKDREDKVWQIMKAVGLSPPDDFVNRYPHQLSGGQRQRVAIARVMVLNPDFVVADEPTSMLDASISAQIFNILLEMREKFEVTLLFITHSLAAARYLCDRIAVIYKGNMMELGSADQVIQKPKHPYTQALIDALPKFGRSAEPNQNNTLLSLEREAVEHTGCPFFTRCRVANKTKCRLERPLLKETNDSHWVACFYATNGAKKGC